MKGLVVAIDGPSGVGKSTVGKAVAERLGVPYLDTGAMYRAVGLAVKRKGIPLPLGDPEAVVAVASRVDVRVTGSAADARTWLNGEDVSREIRTPEISAYASAVSAVPGVRRRLAGMQRSLALQGGGVLEGRDIGTKVVPETPHKFFLTASPDVRARRRFEELSARGAPQTFAQVLADMEARDRADSTRADSPLVDDGTYTRIDTSALSVEEVVDRLLATVRRGGPPPG
ncbi:MAG TPA: (d)CMP kinase [Thermoanaerobaculia bacterium]|nr:(d)CMP kinase [Thermoanaerobaculia bacterium]